jgi:parvulin-like peptidyl-prolyl isomerase
MSLMWRAVRVCSLLVLIAALPGVAQAQLSPSTVVAKQGGAVITLTDIDAFAQRIPEKDRAGFFDSPERLQALIGSLLVNRQLAAEARTLGLDHDALAKAQIELASDDILAKACMERFKADLKVPAMTELANEEYLGHKEEYVVPGKFDVKQVLVSTQSLSDEQAKALADTVEKKAKAHPDQFDALVEKYSDDPGKATTHGLVTQAGSNTYMPELAKAAKVLKKPGDISAVIKTALGYRVIKLIQRTPDHPQSFAEVRDQILAQLRSDYIAKQVKNHTDVLHNESIDANPDLVASLRTRYGQVPVPPDQAGGKTQ